MKKTEIQDKLTPVEIKIWIPAYRPFIFGGNVNAPIECLVIAFGPFDIGKGLKAHVVIAPSGKTFVAESETGAIVGSSIQDVRKDVSEGDDQVIRDQIEWARQVVKDAVYVTAAEFWTFVNGAL